MRKRVCVIGGCVAAVLVWASLPSGVAAAPQDPNETTCATLLALDEVDAVAGKGFDGPHMNAPRPGFTVCDFQKTGEDGSNPVVSFGFTGLRALEDENSTAERDFELTVQAVESDEVKREDCRVWAKLP